MAADIFESYEVTIVSGLILGLTLVIATGELKWIVYPLIIRAIGVISSILGTFTVPVWEKCREQGFSDFCTLTMQKKPCSVPMKSPV